MERKQYEQPRLRITRLGMHCLLQSISGGGDDNPEQGDAKRFWNYDRFDGEDGGEKSQVRKSLWEDGGS